MSWNRMDRDDEVIFTPEEFRSSGLDWRARFILLLLVFGILGYFGYRYMNQRSQDRQFQLAEELKPQEPPATDNSLVLGYHETPPREVFPGENFEVLLSVEGDSGDCYYQWEADGAPMKLLEQHQAHFGEFADIHIGERYTIAIAVVDSVGNTGACGFSVEVLNPLQVRIEDEGNGLRAAVKWKGQSMSADEFFADWFSASGTPLASGEYCSVRESGVICRVAAKGYLAESSFYETVRLVR